MVRTTQLPEAFCQATHVGAGTYDDSQAYDAVTGNLITKAEQTLAYEDANHKHAATTQNGRTYTYDANGNMATRTKNVPPKTSAGDQVTRTIAGTTYTRTNDAENPHKKRAGDHMTVMSGGGVSASFVYDGDGNRQCEQKDTAW